MKKGPSFTTMIIGLIVFGIGVVATIPSQKAASQKYETDLSNAKDSLVWVYSEMSTSALDYKGSWSGTGFAVGKFGEDVTYVVTNAHVIEQAYAWPLGKDDPFDLEKKERISLDSLLNEYGMTIKDLDMKTKIRVYYSEDNNDYDEPEIVYYSGPSEYDIAILKLDTPSDKIKPVLFRNPSTVLSDRSTYMASYMGNKVAMGYLDSFISDTNINAYNHAVDDIIVTELDARSFENLTTRDYANINLNDYLDSSEVYGPVFDENGNVAGITTNVELNWFYSQKKYVLPSEKLVEILEAEKIDYTMTGPKYPEAQTYVLYSLFACIVGLVMFAIAFIVYSIHKKRDPGTAVAVVDASQTFTVPVQNSSIDDTYVSSYEAYNQIQTEQESKPVVTSVQSTVEKNNTYTSSYEEFNQIHPTQESKPVAVSVVSNSGTVSYDQNNAYRRRYNEFIITDKSITYKNIEYPYSSICNLVLLWNATSSSHGAIELWGPGMKKSLIMQFNLFETGQLMKDLDYANNQIDKAHGRQKHFRYCFQSVIDTKVEVYDDYVIAYTLDRGFMQSFRNAASGGMLERVVKFSDLNVVLYDNPKHVNFVLDGKKIDVSLSSKNYQNAKEAVEYINRVKVSPIADEVNIDAINKEWQPSTGIRRIFQLEDKELVISAEMDLFNSYMLRFRHLASLCTNELIAESRRKVHDLQTYVRFFPFIYDKYLDVLISKAIDILVAEGVWDVTHEALKNAHYEEVGTLAVDDMGATISSILATIENNQSHPLTAILGVVPQAYEKLSQITTMQQNGLFEQIDFAMLYDHVYRDYALVFASMAAVLKNNGKDIWFFPSDLNNARNTFQNITHPNFPEGKRIEAFFKIITMDPYQIEYYQYMVKQWGENEQTTAIKNYFGFLDFNNPRMCISR